MTLIIIGLCWAAVVAIFMRVGCTYGSTHP